MPELPIQNPLKSASDPLQSISGPSSLQPGNYPSDYIEHSHKKKEYVPPFMDPPKAATLAFLDIHNFTPSSNECPNEKLAGFLEVYWGNVIRKIGDKGGRINKIMGDGIFASFDDEFSACSGCMAAVEWWNEYQEEFPAPFNSPSTKLVAIMGTLNVRRFRNGDRSCYLDVSWIGAELNTFFKHSKVDELSNVGEPIVWINERATRGLINTGLKIAFEVEGALVKSEGIELATIPSAGNPGRYFGIYSRTWRKLNGLPEKL